MSVSKYDAAGKFGTPSGTTQRHRNRKGVFIAVNRGVSTVPTYVRLPGLRATPSSDEPPRWVPSFGAYLARRELALMPCCPKCYAIAGAFLSRYSGRVSWVCRDQCGWWRRVVPGTPEAFQHRDWRKGLLAFVDRHMRRRMKKKTRQRLDQFLRENKKPSVAVVAEVARFEHFAKKGEI